MIRLDLTAEVTALRDKAVQPSELGELFAMHDSMPEEFKQLFRSCNTYPKLLDVLVALEDNSFIHLHYVK
jgi:hypothetical protein